MPPRKRTKFEPWLLKTFIPYGFLWTLLYTSLTLYTRKAEHRLPSTTTFSHSSERKKPQAKWSQPRLTMRSKDDFDQFSKNSNEGVKRYPPIKVSFYLSRCYDFHTKSLQEAPLTIISAKNTFTNLSSPYPL